MRKKLRIDVKQCFHYFNVINIFLFLNLPIEHEEEVARIEKYAEIFKNEDSVSTGNT